MRRFISIIGLVLVLGAIAGSSSAPAEDGDPTIVPKPIGCTNVTVDHPDDDYFASAPDQSECVTGGSGSNQIWTFGGRDWVNALAGEDQIEGGDQQDTLFGGKSGDVIDGEGGDDFIRVGCPNGCDQTGQNAYDIARGRAGDDTIGAANNFLTHVEGGDGTHDVCYFDKGLDVVSGCEDKRPQ